MQPTHHLKPAGVKATAITSVVNLSAGNIYFYLADDQAHITYGSASPGDLYVQYPDGKSEILQKDDFESRYEPCDPVLRPQFHPMPPAEVIDAANLVSRYFDKQNIEGWELGGCKARFPRDVRIKTRLTSRERAPLHLKDMEEQRSMFEAMIARRGHGSVERHSIGRYSDSRIQSTWDVWKACIEANILREARA